MKYSHLSWPALVLGALLAACSASAGEFASELSEQREVSSRRDAWRDAAEARGLLTGRPSSPADRLGISGGSDGVATASWSSSLTTMGGPPPASSPLADFCDDCDCCPDPLWCHRSGAFFDLLILRPGNIDYVYAVEQTGTLPTDSPTGPTGRVGFDTAPGYRLGYNHAISDCTSLQASYTWFETGTNHTIAATPGTVLVFQPGVPSIPNVGAASNQATARYDIKFQQLDFDYRGLLYGTCDSALNYFAGLRYANLEQRFSAEENIGVPVGFTNVNSDIDFDGFGIGFGLDGIRRSAYSGLLIYGRGSASFVGGEFKADFRQTTQFGPNSLVGNSLVDYRVLTILQTELGLGWQSQCGTFRTTVGYQVNGWFNSLTTGTYVAGVQTRTFDELWETISFDGFAGRVEWRF